MFYTVMLTLAMLFGTATETITDNSATTNATIQGERGKEESVIVPGGTGFWLPKQPVEKKR